MSYFFRNQRPDPAMDSNISKSAGTRWCDCDAILGSTTSPAERARKEAAVTFFDALGAEYGGRQLSKGSDEAPIKAAREKAMPVFAI